MNEKAHMYGARYFGIELVGREEEYIYADEVKVDASGTLLIYGAFRKTPEAIPEKSELLLAVAPGQWIHVYAASILTSDPVAIV